MSENQEQTHPQDQVDPQPCCAGGGCCPSESNHSSQRGKIIAFILIVVAAGAVLANSLIRKSQADADQSEQTFASIPMDSETETATVVETDKAEGDTGKGTSSLWKTELTSLDALNQMATDVDAVFVFLGSSGERASKGITQEMDAALEKI